jgi:hypothetical protein
VLKKGDKVAIHTHRYEELYKGKVFTCSTDEEFADSMEESIVFLKELTIYRWDNIGKSFLTRFLKKVDD